MSNPSPSSKPKWAGRLNSAVRRSSTMLSFGRNSSSSRPSSIHGDRERDSFDSTSVTKQKLDTTQATLAPAPAKHVVPSPVNESPARERAAEADAVGPSSLNQVLQEAAGSEQAEAMSPTGYVPPPLINSSLGNPGAFTDQADELPQPVTVSDPFMPPKPSSTRGPPSSYAPSVHETPASIPVSKVHAEAPPTESEPDPSGPHDGPSAPAAAPMAGPPSNVTGEVDMPAPVPVLESEPASTPSPPIPEPEPASAPPSPIPERGPASAPPPPIPEPEPVSVPLAAPPAQIDMPEPLPTPSFEKPDSALSYSDPSNPQPSGHDVSGNVAVSQFPVPAPVSELDHAAPVDNTGIVINPMPVPVHEQHSLQGQDESMPSREPVFRALPVDPRWPSQEAWGGDRHDQSNSNGSAHYDVPSMKSNGYSDPFSPPLAPRITVSDANTYGMPSPHMSAPTHEERHEETSKLEFPHAGPICQSPPSTHLSRHRRETNETQPLLGTSKGQSYLGPPTGRNTNVNVSPLNAGSISSWTPQAVTSIPRLHDLGWIEYHLPDGTFYYVHPTRRVTTDLNLRVERILNGVTTFLENLKDDVPNGCEMWLRAGRDSKKGFVPTRSWVNHQTRSVIIDGGRTQKKSKKVDEDQLDMEYRYWSFMECHPAHAVLPLNAKNEAFEALSWAWTDRLLPSNQVVPAPFSQDECQELNSLLRSFNADQDGIQTRLVARILIRIAIWRQAFFRPNKPLPTDVVSSLTPMVRRRRPIVRSFFDVIISIICLGIPYIFYERHTQHRIDEESNLRSASPMFIIGACTCIVAAIVLSAAVTFLSLPGLVGVARIAGLVTTLFASFSIAATLVAVFRYKADLVRNAPQIGEGIMWVSKRSFIFSLPMVFLAYAVIGFITAIAFYYFKGPVSINVLTLQNTFAYNTRWTTVTAVGAVAGVLTMSALLFRL